MKNVKAIFILFFGVTVLIFSCSKGGGGGAQPGNNPEINCDNINAKFAADVLPIVQANCAIGGCHGNGSTNGPGALTNFNQIKNAAGTIRSAVISGRMPLGSSLSSAQIALIACWVDNGALNN